MLYEIDNPKKYLLPDVILDFTNVKLKQLESSKGGTGSF
jgi:hypothetical protein